MYRFKEFLISCTLLVGITGFLFLPDMIYRADSEPIQFESAQDQEDQTQNQEPPTQQSQTIEISNSTISLVIIDQNNLPTVTRTIQNYDDLNDVKIESTNNILEVVHNNGTLNIKGLRRGTSDITISASGCDSVTFKVTVEKFITEEEGLPTDISFSPSKVTLYTDSNLGDTTALVSISNYAQLPTVDKYKLSQGGIAQVTVYNNTIRINALDAGTTVLTLYYNVNGRTIRGSLKITVKDNDKIDNETTSSKTISSKSPLDNTTNTNTKTNTKTNTITKTNTDTKTNTESNIFNLEEPNSTETYISLDTLPYVTNVGKLDIAKYLNVNPTNLTTPVVTIANGINKTNIFYHDKLYNISILGNSRTVYNIRFVEDVPVNAWFFIPISNVMQKGLLGTVDGLNFKPNAPITYDAVFKGLSLTLLYTNNINSNQYMSRDTLMKCTEGMTQLNPYYMHVCNVLQHVDTESEVIRYCNAKDQLYKIEVTRGHMANLLYQTFKHYDLKQTKIKVAFTDTTPTDYIQFVCSTGLMKGDTAGKFNPNRKLTRAEFSVILDILYESLNQNNK